MPSYVVHVICQFDSYDVEAKAANPMAAMIDTLVMLRIDTLEHVVGIEISPL